MMGANVLYRVKVLRLVEDIVEVCALHEGDALKEAETVPGVAKALEVIYGEEGK